jgi:hypothetical protein
MLRTARFILKLDRCSCQAQRNARATPIGVIIEMESRAVPMATPAELNSTVTNPSCNAQRYNNLYDELHFMQREPQTIYMKLG